MVRAAVITAVLLVLVLVLGPAVAGIGAPAALAPQPSAGGPALWYSPPVRGKVPWWNDAVFYTVFIRSFKDNNGDGIGDLDGLISRLDYLNDGDPNTDQDLGVTALRLLPVMQSPSYHGFDTSDYRTVEEDYGTNEDFKDLIAQAQQRGMKVIVDLSLNATSREHPWFVAARDPASPTRDFYVWSDDEGGSSYRTRVVWHATAQGSYLGLAWAGMPDLNYSNSAVTAEMVATARFWLQQMGVDGFFLNSVQYLREYRDSYDGLWATHNWLADFDDRIDAVAPDALTIGSIAGSDSTAAQYVTDDELDLTLAPDLADGLFASLNAGDADSYVAALDETLLAYPSGQFAVALSDLEPSRAMTQLHGSQDRARLAATVLLTMPGVPMLYYGDEIGMTGSAPRPWPGRPMQWESREGAGFAVVEPWLSIDASAAQVNVTRQRNDPQSLLSHYRQLIGIRSEHPSLRFGDLRQVQSSCPDAPAFLRTLADGEDPLLVQFNFANDATRDCVLSTATSPLSPGWYQARDLFTKQPAVMVKVGFYGEIADYVPLRELQPQQALVLALSRQKG